MGEIERIGNFVYFYQEDGTVVITCIELTQNEALQMIEEKMKGIGKKTGEYKEIIYNDETYVGMVFESVSELMLIVTLTR